MAQPVHSTVETNLPWEEAIQHLKESNHPFGGLVVALMFDHFQLLPVRGTPLYRTATTMTFTPSQERASMLYRSIEKVVYLEDNMRFEQDPEWGHWLRQARMGDWNENLRDFLRSSEVQNPKASISEDFIQVISTDNVTRCLVNDVAIRTIGAEGKNDKEQIVYVVPSQVSTRISSSTFCQLRTLSDNQTGNVPLFFKCFIGMSQVMPMQDFSLSI